MSITGLPDEELRRSGRQFKTDSVLEQANVSMKRASGDAKIKATLGEGFFADLGQAFGTLAARAGQRQASKQEAKTATQLSREASRALARWNREFAAQQDRLRRSGLPVPAALARVGKRVSSASGLREECRAKLALVPGLQLPEAVAAEVAALAAKGQKLLDEYMEATASRGTLSKALPQETTEENRLKGVLYQGIKMINATARQVYADQPEVAATFDVSMLRPSRRQKAAPAPAVMGAATEAGSGGKVAVGSGAEAGVGAAAVPANVNGSAAAYGGNGTHAMAGVGSEGSTS